MHFDDDLFACSILLQGVAALPLRSMKLDIIAVMTEQSISLEVDCFDDDVAAALAYHRGMMVIFLKDRLAHHFFLFGDSFFRRRFSKKTDFMSSFLS